ncbi:3'-5' exonuclease [Patescibacteria group bacterium]|nr:3'-5' exonuclease [Patescibacteria group bacterium]MBU1683129.1 3'-5' exonuclease [Patescibacteria group bacterium]MBU1934654.1 3'-5' exonuclease [Patescibacteria group bacterium]
MKIVPFQDFIQRYYSGEEFVVFDTETTGLNTYHDDIIEVAGAIWQKDGEIKTFEELVWTNPRKVTGEAQAIHGISVEEVEKARKPEEVFGEFVEFCENRPLVAHNIRFDFPMLNSNLIRSGLKPYPNEEVMCSYIYAKEQMLPGKLIDLASHYKVKTDSDNLHRAMYDVNVLMEILNKVMKENEPDDMQYSLIL